MSPETYYRIVFLMLARDSVALGFSLANFFANGGKEILLEPVLGLGTGYQFVKAAATAAERRQRI